MTNPSLPSEILDYVTDLLHNEPETLEQCCLVSKSWLPRARKYLFAVIKFSSASDLESWKKTFPDAANSPAYHARTLLVGCPRLVTASDAEEGGWIRAFSGVASLGVDDGQRYIDAAEVSLAPLHGFSPTLKSLRVCLIRFQQPQIFDLVHSFPLLENLSLAGRNRGPVGDDGDPHGLRTVVPSTSLSFTGSLDLKMRGGVWSAARPLLDLSNGLHFQKFTVLWDCKEDLRWIMGLVVTCSHTLELLDITHAFYLGSGTASLNLSKATKLREALFRPESKSVEWITMALQTITPEHRDLRRISIYVPVHLTFSSVGANIGQYLGGVPSKWWSDLDHLLVRFWESCSIRPRVGCARQGEEGQNTEYCIGCLLPEATKRRIVDTV